MRIFLGGVNGSGKTTLLNKIKEARPEIEVIKGSQLLMDFLGISGDYEALRALPHDYGMERLEELMNSLTAEKTSFILDSHYLNLVRGQIKSVTGPFIKNFNALFLLRARPEIIMERISADGHLRDRALFPDNINDEEKICMLSSYMKQYEEELRKVSHEYSLNSCIIDTDEKNPDQVRDEFLSFVDNIKI